jgi:hypothetical protein
MPIVFARDIGVHIEGVLSKLISEFVALIVQEIRYNDLCTFIHKSASDRFSHPASATRYYGDLLKQGTTHLFSSKPAPQLLVTRKRSVTAEPTLYLGRLGIVILR